MVRSSTKISKRDPLFWHVNFKCFTNFVPLTWAVQPCIITEILLSMCPRPRCRKLLRRIYMNKIIVIKKANGGDFVCSAHFIPKQYTHTNSATEAQSLVDLLTFLVTSWAFQNLRKTRFDPPFRKMVFETHYFEVLRTCFWNLGFLLPNPGSTFAIYYFISPLLEINSRQCW